MLTHSIAGLKVGIEYNHPRMINQSAMYIVDGDETDFDIVIPKKILKLLHENNPQLSMDECEYIETGMFFYKKIVDYNAMLLHASAVVKDGYAYLFSAPSGTGKSTHTKLWQKAFPDAVILNDDKPVIRAEGERVNAYGTPWSGKTDQNLNLCVPIGGICFLERSEENFIKEVPPEDAIPMILNQTIRPKKPENIDKVLNVLGKILEGTKVYKMGCNISVDAAIMAYEAMRIK